MSTSPAAQHKLLTTLNAFKLHGFNNIRLEVSDSAQMILLASEKLSETETREHRQIIYTPRNGMTRTASKTHLALYQTLNYWSRQNPGYCKDGTILVHKVETLIYILCGLILLVITIYAIADKLQ